MRMYLTEETDPNREYIVSFGQIKEIKPQGLHCASELRIQGCRPRRISMRRSLLGPSTSPSTPLVHFLVLISRHCSLSICMLARHSHCCRRPRCSFERRIRLLLRLCHALHDTRDDREDRGLESQRRQCSEYAGTKGRDALISPLPSHRLLHFFFHFRHYCHDFRRDLVDNARHHVDLVHGIGILLLS